MGTVRAAAGDDRCEDLRLARRLGCLLLSVRGSGTVSLDGVLLRWDPEMCPHDRAQRVCELLRGAQIPFRVPV